MSVTRRPLLIAGLLAAGSAPLLLTLALQSSPAPAALQSPKQVADDLDKIVQPRFQDASAGKFGLTRLVPAVNGHQSIGFVGYFKAATPVENRSCWRMRTRPTGLTSWLSCTAPTYRGNRR